MLTQQNLSDKSIADAVEALIGAHLLELGPTAALKFMKWLGLKVLTKEELGPPEIPLFRYIDTVEQVSLKGFNNALCFYLLDWISFSSVLISFYSGFLLRTLI